MRTMNQNQCPRNTPWGRADHVEQIIPGMWFVTTPGHGGVYVAPERLAQMPAYMQSTPYSQGGWFEEDVDWCLPVVVFAAELTAADSRYTKVDTETGNPYYLDAFKYEYHNERRARWEAGVR